MIAKCIAAPKASRGFQGLGAYVLNVRSKDKSADPASWQRLDAYILDAEHGGAKVAWARVSNCVSTDPGWAVKEITATQARNTRSRAGKDYHLVVSFPEGERPTREQMEDIEDRLCEALGFGEHQRVSAVHQNTDNWHLHVAINKVHPVTLRNATPHRDHYRLQAACAELEVKHGLTQEPHTLDGQDRRERKARGRAADFEARHGGQSFIAWTQEHAGAALLAARDSGRGWQAVHQVTAAFDLELRPRGAGLVISHKGDKRLHVKASDVDRGLSLKAMTDALGPYEPAMGQAQEQGAKARYERPTPSGDLYQAFQRERAAALSARNAALAALAAQHGAYARDLAAWYRQRMRSEHAQGLRGSLRREGFQHIAAEREKDRAARIEREAAQRRAVRQAHAIPAWQGYLEAEAANGNVAALASLRSRQRRAQRIASDILTAANAETARHVLHQHMKPAIRRDGRVIYRMPDGGLVSDEKVHVRVPQPTTAAAFLALSLAAERFGARPLIVAGSDEFRAQVAKVAGIEGMSITFADQRLDQQRKQEAAAKTVGRGADRDNTLHPKGRADRDRDRGR